VGRCRAGKSFPEPDAHRGVQPGPDHGRDMTERRALTRTQQFPCDPTAVRRARALVSEFLAGVGWGAADVERARLAASELVANAVVHAGSEPTLTITYEDGTLRLGVTDDDPASDPRPSEAVRPEGGGLGLRLVTVMSRDWGVDRTSTAKTVWCLLEPQQADVRAGADA
jgi:anti-sigma regulatory factor (Ser/Thr protein kinase)